MSLNAAALYALVGVQGAGQSVRDLQSVSNQVNKTQSVMNGVGKGVGQMGKGFGQVGAGLLRVGEYVGLAAAGAVIASAKVGASFQSMTELIHTQAGASQDEVEKMRAGIMGMVHDVGTTPGELAKGIYHIESVGLRDAAALDVLRASALGAKVGLADMESVTNALTAVTYSQITGTKGASDAMAILDGIVGVGNMHLQDLTDSFKSGILGTGAAFGVTLQSLGAAIATLTDAGVPANIAATRLNMTIAHMGAPTAKAIDTLKGLGISQFQLATDMRGPNGIDAALRDIGKHMQDVGEMSASGVLTPKGVADLTKIFGGSRFGATAMQLLTNAMADAAHGGDRLAAKYDLITERAKTFNDNVEATKQTAGYVWGLLVADIQNAGLAFSQGFLPGLARAGSKLDEFVFSHLGDIRQLGVELGAWMDKIDWNQVADGANGFLSIMKTVLDVVSKLPPQVDLAIVGFLGLNKVSGGLLGAGVGNIVGGLTGILGSLAKAGARGLLSKIPVVGGALAQATSTPVFVTNWPGGFGLPGGLPAVATGGAAGAAELGASAGVIGAGAIFTAALPFIGIIAAATVADMARHDGHVTPIGSPHGLMSPKGGTPPPVPPPVQVNGNVTVGGFDKRYGPGGVTAGGFTADLQKSHITMGGFDDRVKASGSALASMSAAALAAKSGLGKMSGNFKTVLSGIEKRSAAKYGGTGLGHSAVMGTFERNLLHSEKLILGSHKTTNDKIKNLQHLESLAVAGKDWGVAKKLKADIAHLKATLKTAIDKNKTATDQAKLAQVYAAHATTQAVKDKDMSVTIPITTNAYFSLQGLKLKQTTYARAGRILQ